MNTKLVLLSITLAGSIAAVTATAQSTPDARSSWLSIPQVYTKLEAAGYSNIEEIDREHGTYEVKATNREGQRVKLYIHPHTGEVIGVKHRKNKDKNSRWLSHKTSDGQSGVECSKRRCRDDLPAMQGDRP
jgi:hypothetical protein